MHYVFDDYLFEVGKGLRWRGQPIHLPPKASRLLQVLLDAEGRAVGKGALAVAVWGGADVSDDSIARTVYRLRAALQAAGGPDVVETLYNAGLRVTVPIRCARPERVATAQGIGQSNSAQAIAAMMGARELAGRRGPADLRAAAQSARAAVEIDPAYLAGWTALAEIHVLQATRCAVPPREAGRWAMAAARSALTLDGDCAAALAVRGFVTAVIEWRVGAGLADLDRAADIDPDYWGSHVLRAWALQAAGRVAEAVEVMQRALELNAVGPAVNGLPAAYLLFAGRRGEALALARALAQRFPTVDNAHAVASVVASVNGQHDEAVAFGEHARLLAPDTPLMQVPLACAWARTGRREDARALVASIESSAQPLAGMTAAAHFALGDRALAVTRLVESYEAGLPQFCWSRDDPRIEPLRGEPALERLWASLAHPAAGPRR